MLLGADGDDDLGEESGSSYLFVATCPDTWFSPDGDGDGFTTDGDPVGACAAPSGYATASEEEDCDDAEASVYPGAEEVPDDGIDQDCDGEDTVTPETDTESESEADTGPDAPPTESETDTEETDAPVPSDTDEEKGGGCASTGAPLFAGAWPVLLLGWRRRR